MARPKPLVLLESIDQATQKSEQIIAADAVYAVYYKFEPISIRKVWNVGATHGPKYKKCTFPNAGFALKLANDLNAQYNTTEFKVYRLGACEEVTE